MEFLLPTMGHGETDTNIPSPSEKSRDKTLENEDGEHDGDYEEQDIHTEPSAEPGPSFKRKRRRVKARGAGNVIQFMEEKETQREHKKNFDELDLFFASISQTVHKLPRSYQIKVKREILDCVSSAEEEWVIPGGKDLTSVHTSQSLRAPLNRQPSRRVSSYTFPPSRSILPPAKTLYEESTSDFDS
ncbi:uncharacterized protein LOC129004514 [Macrosteles quadrilineatus]|uniref:uncharacterized protein LOC129004514 n=1 Tax=Macrosteles quadrilineatus TaxID=74068 RepID=UPI0023E17836|nr:uncharacterized protein LOC129004514 [Macrosteles quadrilineatus]